MRRVKVLTKGPIFFSSRQSKSYFLFYLVATLVFNATGSPIAMGANKVGANCYKTGQISGTLKCAKNKSGKLVWTSIPKSKDEIALTLQGYSYIEDGNIPLLVSSKSGISVEVTNFTQDICQLNGSVVTPLKVGKCQLSFSTQGSSKFLSTSRSESLNIKKRNQFSFQPENQYLLSAGTLVLPSTSSAGLTMEYLSETLSNCIVRGNVVEFRAAGNCLITSEQRGDAFTDSIPRSIFTLNIVRENKITFALPNELALKLKTYALNASSSSGLPVSFRTSTTEICDVSTSTLNLKKTGTCTVIASQQGDSSTLRAEEVSYTVKISGNRVLADQPDSLSGFQIKPIYVVPSDGEDRQYDINGYIAEALTEGNSMLKLGIGYEFQVDSIGSDFDIQYFKSSMTKSYMQSSSNIGTELMKEMRIIDNLGENRKNFIFFIDVDSFKYDTACGYAGMPGIYAVVAVGPGKGSGTNCVGKSLQLTNYISHTWVHEAFHNLGVDHTNNDSCDLMRGSGSSYCQTSWTIDKDRNRYVGSSNQGVNVLSLRVWKGYTADQSLRASCSLPYSSVPRADGLRYAVCPTGKQIIGALTYCWSSIRSAELHVWRDNSWVSLGQGNVYNEPWGKYVEWKCNNSSYVAPWMEVTVSTPGPQKYRWMINGTESEQFVVVWQR